MAGIANSWIEQYTTVPTPCIADTPQGSTLASCVLWLVIGLIIGGVTFQKKGTQQ